MPSIHNELREKFKTSNALSSLKEISQSMSREDFRKFSYIAMKSAYDDNRMKAVKFLLSFHEHDDPILLLKIHLSVMMEDSKKLESGKKMLKVIIKNFSSDLCYEILNNIVKYHNGKTEYVNREKEITKIILEEKIPENNQTLTKKIKI